jgi:hypothetical protein
LEIGQFGSTSAGGTFVMVTGGFVLVGGVLGVLGSSEGGSMLGGGSGCGSSWLGSVRLVVGRGLVVLGAAVDDSGSVVMIGAWIGLGSSVVVGAMTIAVVVVTTAGGIVDGVSLGAGRWAIDGVADVVVTDVLVAAGGTGPESSAGTTRNAAGAPRAATPPTPSRTSAAPTATRPLRRVDKAFPDAAAAWFDG